MRTYNEEQKNSTLFEGSKAGKIVELRQAMDRESSDICSRLHEAYDTAQEEFKQLSLRYQPQLKIAMQGTELESVPIEQIGFDFTNAEKHGIVIARQIGSNPIEAFLNMLRTVTESGPSVGDDDRIYVEPSGNKTESSYKPDVARAWGADQRVDA